MFVSYNSAVSSEKISSSDAERALLGKPVEDLVEVYLAMSNIIDALMMEASSRCLLCKLVERVVKHDLTSCLKRELEYKVQQRLEL